MKKIFTLLVSGTILFTTSFAQFTDVDQTHWAYSAITRMKESEILSGYEDGTFKPTRNITLAEFATIFCKVFGIQKENSNYFTDIKINHWAKGNIEAIREYINPYYDSIGEAIGVNNYSYLPGLTGDMEMTREAFVYSISRIYGYENDKYIANEEKEIFADYQDILYPREMVLAYKNGVISGEEIDGKVYINPNRNITRAEASAIFNNLLKYNVKSLNNRGEEPNLKARYNEVIKLLKDDGVDSIDTFLYDTQEILSSDKINLSYETKDLINELISLILLNYHHEILDAKFINFNRGYISLKYNTYDINSYLPEILKLYIISDEEGLNGILSEVKNKILLGEIEEVEKEGVFYFAKYDAEWKLILK